MHTLTTSPWPQEIPRINTSSRSGPSIYINNIYETENAIIDSDCMDEIGTKKTSTAFHAIPLHPALPSDNTEQPTETPDFQSIIMSIHCSKTAFGCACLDIRSHTLAIMHDLPHIVLGRLDALQLSNHFIY